jgi:tetratricopeptide (TPR) repeat protein
VLALAALLLALVGASGCGRIIDSLKARDQLNKGVTSYKNARYEEAIEHFKNAVALDPKLLNARLYLATAYAQQVVPGVDTDENKRTAHMAIDEFQKVLDENPKDEQKVSGLKGIASLYFNINDLDKAKEYNLKVTQLDPNDPETYYTIGVIDWTETYKPRMEERAKLGLNPNEPLKDKKVCEQLRASNLPKVEEGIKMLDKALQLRPDYDDAMAYMNLMYREQADIECGDPAARADDLKKADEWVNKTLATKKMKAEKAQSPGGIVTEPSK